MSRKKKALRFGETPFHRMPKKQLLRVTFRLYAALSAAHSMNRQAQAADECIQRNNPYWGPEGRGAKILEMGRQALEAAQAGFPSDEVYGAFFRYAQDLLFESTALRLTSGWTICDQCGWMLGANGKGETSAGQPCDIAFGRMKRHCSGTMHILTWEDLDFTQHKPEGTSKQE